MSEPQLSGHGTFCSALTRHSAPVSPCWASPLNVCVLSPKDIGSGPKEAESTLSPYACPKAFCPFTNLSMIIHSLYLEHPNSVLAIGNDVFRIVYIIAYYTSCIQVFKGLQNHQFSLFVFIFYQREPNIQERTWNQRESTRSFLIS